MFADFTVYLPQQKHLSPYLADILRELDEQGIEYTLGPTSTSMRGNAESIFKALHRCYKVLRENNEEIIMTVQLVEQKHESRSLREAVDSVKEQLRAS
jgi:uncharacterized protein YqgV (UPF0045/DUF77 family)